MLLVTIRITCATPDDIDLALETVKNQIEQGYTSGADKNEPVKVQQRFYNATMRLINDLTATTGMDASSIWEQIEARARALGAIRPQPGQHY